MASLISDVGKQAKRNIVRSVLGSSAIGRALSKTVLKKNRDDESAVEEALHEQTQVQEENSATVVRIESVVLNIADNIYNIAAVWSDHVVSMKEANRLQQERISKEQALKEENENEAAKLLAPLPSGTTPTETSGKKGLLSELMGSVGGTKNMLRGLMKKFAVLAAGVVATGGLVAGTAAMANENQPSEQTQEEQVADKSNQDVVYDEMGNPVSNSSTPQPLPVTAQPPLPSPTPVPPTAATATTRNTSASIPPTPVSSPLVTSTQSTTTQTGQQFIVKTPNGPLTFQNEEQYKKWNNDPSKFAISITPESGGTRSVVVPLTQQISPQIINNLQGGGNAPADVKNIFSQIQTNPVTPPPSGVSSGSTSNGSSDSPPPPSLMSIPPSIGAELGRASTALDAAFSQMKESSNQIIQTSTNSQSPDSMASPTPIPSPIANRGTLDVGTTFTTYY